jgi:hypothetical protein
MAGQTVGEHQGARALPWAVAARTVVVRHGLATRAARGCTAAMAVPAAAAVARPDGGGGYSAGTGRRKGVGGREAGKGCGARLCFARARALLLR